MAEEQTGSTPSGTATCDDCHQEVEATKLVLVTCVGTCAQMFKVCELCKAEPYTCVVCDEETDEDDEDDDDEQEEKD